MPNELKTDQELLERLRAAAAKGVSSEEIRRQRLSFVYGNMPAESPMTKDQVRQIIDKHEGIAA